MKRIMAIIVLALVIGLFSSHLAVASQVNFIVQGADRANWTAGIYDDKKPQTETFAGYYNTIYDFGIGWDAPSGIASFKVGGADAKFWDTGLDGQVPGLISLKANDLSKKFSYDVSLIINPSLLKPIKLSSSIAENSKSDEITMYPAAPPFVSGLSHLWFIGNFDFGQLDRNDNPGNMNISWLISMDSFKPVPIPGAVWLLGTGIVGLLAIRRRRN